MNSRAPLLVRTACIDRAPFSISCWKISDGNVICPAWNEGEPELPGVKYTTRERGNIGRRKNCHPPRTYFHMPKSVPTRTPLGRVFVGDDDVHQVPTRRPSLCASARSEVWAGCPQATTPSSTSFSSSAN